MNDAAYALCLSLVSPVDWLNLIVWTELSVIVSYRKRSSCQLSTARNDCFLHSVHCICMISLLCWSSGLFRTLSPQKLTRQSVKEMHTLWRGPLRRGVLCYGIIGTMDNPPLMVGESEPIVITTVECAAVLHSGSTVQGQGPDPMLWYGICGTDVEPKNYQAVHR
jgi:hypothetical protein